MIDACVIVFVVAVYANLVPLAGAAGLPESVLGAFLLALVAVPAAIQVFVRRRRPVIDAPYVAMLVFLAALLVSTFAARDAPTALDWISTYVTQGVLLYVLVVNAVRSDRALRRVAWALVLTGAVLGTLSAYQEIASAYDRQFGGLAQRSLERGMGVEATQHGLIRTREQVHVANRAGGPIGDPNRYAQMLLVALPFAIFLVRRSGSGRARLAAAAAALALLCGVFLTYSRGGFLALAVLVAAMLALGLVRWREVLPAVLLAVLLAATLAAGTGDRLRSVGSVAGLLSDRSTATSDGAVRGRMTEMLAALRVFMDHPAVGVGPGHFAPYYSVDYMSDPEIAFRRINVPRHAHNLYLELAAETGLAGLAAFLGIVTLMFVRLASAHHRWARRAPEHADLAAASIAALLAYLTTGLFLQLSYQRYFWLVAALAGATASVLFALPEPEGRARGGRRDQRGQRVEGGQRGDRG